MYIDDLHANCCFIVYHVVCFIYIYDIISVLIRTRSTVAQTPQLNIITRLNGTSNRKHHHLIDKDVRE